MCLDVLHLPLISWLGHVVWALWGQQIVSRVTCLLHRLLFKTCMWHRKGWGQDAGLDGTQNVSTGLSLLIPSSLFLIIIFNFYLSKEANGPNFKPKLLVWVPKVSHHDIHDWNLINLGSIDLHHSLSVAFPRLQQERHQQINQGCRRTELFWGFFLINQLFSPVLSYFPVKNHFEHCCWQSLPHIRLRWPWSKGYCHRTSPRRWHPGSAAPCCSCRSCCRATPQTGGSCRWSFAWPRPSVVWGRSSAPY